MYGDKYLVNTGYARKNTTAWVEKTCPSRCRRCRGGRCKRYCSHWNWCGSSEAHITGGRGGTNCLGCDVDNRSLFEIVPASGNTNTRPKFHIKNSMGFLVQDNLSRWRPRKMTYTTFGSKNRAILFQG